MTQCFATTSILARVFILARDPQQINNFLKNIKKNLKNMEIILSALSLNSLGSIYNSRPKTIDLAAKLNLVALDLAIISNPRPWVWREFQTQDLGSKGLTQPKANSLGFGGNSRPKPLSLAIKLDPIALVLATKPNYFFINFFYYKQIFKVS